MRQIICGSGGRNAWGPRGFSPDVLLILESLNLDVEEWVNTVESYKNGFIWWLKVACEAIYWWLKVA